MFGEHVGMVGPSTPDQQLTNQRQEQAQKTWIGERGPNWRRTLCLTNVWRTCRNCRHEHPRPTTDKPKTGTSKENMDKRKRSELEDDSLRDYQSTSLYVSPRSTRMSLAERDESDMSRNHVLLLHKPF
ncbi:unnamed protein product [Arctogadus glacialis]